MPSQYSESGLTYMFLCFREQGDDIDLYCYTSLLEDLLALMMIILCAIIIIMRSIKQNKFSLFRLKQLIIIIIFINLIVFLSYQWTYASPLLYFPESYFQYIYFSCLIYYFAKKTILLGIINSRTIASVPEHIDPIIQLKITKFMCYGFFFFFTIIIIMNYIDYFDIIAEAGTYNLCQAGFFNTITTVGFFMQSLFLLQIYQLQRRIRINYRNTITESQLLVGQQKVNDKLAILWSLVMVLFFGSFLKFLQNIFFQINSEIKGHDYECTYIMVFQQDYQLPKNKNMENNINVSIGFIIKVISFFLPYLLTIFIFWCPIQQAISKNELEESVQQETIDIKINFQQSSIQNGSIE